jgi:hypothetical protein
MIETFKAEINVIRPDDDKIEYLAEFKGKIIRFDPFVSCHLRWHEVASYVGKKVIAEVFPSSGDPNCFLVSKIISVT